MEEEGVDHRRRHCKSPQSTRAHKDTQGGNIVVSFYESVQVLKCHFLDIERARIELELRTIIRSIQ